MVEVVDTCTLYVFLLSVPPFADVISDNLLLTLAGEILEQDYLVIGTRLGHSTTRLDHLRHDHVRDSRGRNFQMLLEWRQRRAGAPDTLQSRLIEALKSAQRMDLVAKVSSATNGR